MDEPELNEIIQFQIIYVNKYNKVFGAANGGAFVLNDNDKKVVRRLIFIRTK